MNVRIEYDGSVSSDDNNTVAYHLKLNNLPVPNEWYDDLMKNVPKNPDFI